MRDGPLAAKDYSASGAGLRSGRPSTRAAVNDCSGHQHTRIRSPAGFGMAERSRGRASLAEGSATWAPAWPCIHEFLAIVTNARIYKPPTPISSGGASRNLDGVSVVAADRRVEKAPEGVKGPAGFRPYCGRGCSGRDDRGDLPGAWRGRTLDRRPGFWTLVRPQGAQSAGRLKPGDGFAAVKIGLSAARVFRSQRHYPNRSASARGGGVVPG